MIEFSFLWLLWWFDITCKALLLGGVAFFAILLTRVRDPNIRHRVWTGVLCGMWCLPLLVLVTPRVPFPNWFQLPSAVHNAEQSYPSDVVATLNDTVVDIARAESPVAISAWTDEQLTAPRLAPPHESAQPITEDTVEMVAAAARSTPPPDADLQRDSPKKTLALLAVAAVLGQVTVSVFLLLRVFTGLLLSKRMIDRATPLIAASHGLPANINLLQSNEICVPVTIGFIRPRILLPQGWDQWQPEKTRSVLLHEQAHVRRADWFVTLLSEINCALHWFNPVAWMTRKRLANLAEFNCDDAVLEARGDRAVYATHLIEVATELAQAGKRYHPPRQSIAMARKPMVEERIDAILDDSRRLARRLGRAGIAALLLLIVPIVLLAAALGPTNEREAQAQNPTNDSDKVASHPASVIHEGEDIRYVYSGRVLTPDGKPAAGAKVNLVYWVLDETQGIQEEPDAMTDSAGRFRFEMARADFHSCNDTLPPWQSAWLTVSQSGCGLTSAPAVAFEETGQAIASFGATSDYYLMKQQSVIKAMSEKQGNTITLSEEVKLSGSLVDLEGRPVPDVDVTFIEAFASADGSLDAWLAVANQKDIEFDSTWKLLPKRLGGPLARKLISNTKSDAQGHYTIHGLGKNQVVRLAAQAPQLVSEGIYCRTTEAEPFPMQVGVLGEITVFGDKASLVMVPSRPVEGRVFRKESGEALAGVVVSSHPSMFTRGPGDSKRTGSEFARSVTDGEGKFVLHGLPRVDGNTLHFAPPLYSHALPRSMSIDTSGMELSSVEFDVGLTQGVVVNGRITDQQTSQPIINGFVYYLGVSDSTLRGVRSMPGADYTAVGSRPDPDGRFSIIVPPGLGYVGFRAPGTDYELTYDFPDGFAMLMNGMSLSKSGPYFHALESIDASVENPVSNLSMTVRAGKVYRGIAVDPSNVTIQAGTYVGLMQESSWRRFDNGTFQIANLRAGELRTVACVSEDQQWAGAIIVGSDPAKPIVIEANAAGTIKGRVVDSNGSPLSNVRISGSGAPTRVHKDSPSTQSIPIAQPQTSEIVTNNEGKFVIGGLIGGFYYELSGRVGELFVTERGQLANDVLISPGQTRDLGDVQMVKPSRETKSDSDAPLPISRKDDAVASDSNRPVTSGDLGAVGKVLRRTAESSIDRVMTVSGHVVDAAGASVSGAKLYWPRGRIDNLIIEQVAITNSDGSFQANLEIPNERGQLPQPHLVTAAAGHGVAWADLEKFVGSTSQSPVNDVGIVLPEEFPIRLRVIDSEGKPLRDVTPGISWMACDSSGNLDQFLNGWLVDHRSADQSLDQSSFVATKVLSVQPSGEDGKLIVRGVGHEQLVGLVLTGPQIAQTHVRLLTRPDFAPDRYNAASTAQAMKFGYGVRNVPTLFRSDAQIVLEPGRTVYGVVTDGRTGQPIEGANVEGRTMNRSHGEAKTSRLGEYRISGLSSVDEVISITGVKSDSRYMLFAEAVRQTADLQPIRFDFQLQPGVTITGRVTEHETGRPVSGSVWLVPLPENNWQENPAFASYKPKHTRMPVDENGNFTLIGIPGAHVIMMQASGEMIDGQYLRPYTKGSFSATDQNRVRVHESGEAFYSSKGNEVEFFETCMKVIDIPYESSEFSVDLLVHRGMEIGVELQDEQGSPLSGAIVGGLSESPPTVLASNNSTAQIYALDPHNPRRVLFFHQERSLTGAITLRGDEQERPIVKLTPARHITGKAVDSAGLPIVNARVKLLWTDDTADELQRHLHMKIPQEVTDHDGIFKVCAPFSSKIRLVFIAGTQEYRAQELIDTAQYPGSTSPDDIVIELGVIPAAVRDR